MDSCSDEIDQTVQMSCIIDGIFLQGAAWDRTRHCLIESKRKELVQSMPLIRLVPIEKARRSMNNRLATPVYVTSERRNSLGVGWVFEANLPIDKHRSFWILNNVCLLLNNDN